MDSVQAGEVQSLVWTLRSICATGNGLSCNLKTFGDMPMHSQISMLRDLMSWKKIKTYDYFITKPSLQDGHGRCWYSVQRIYILQKWSSIQNSLQNFRRNKNWASHWCKSRANHDSSWNRNCSSFNTRSFQNILGTDHKRENWFFDEVDDPSVCPHVPSSNLLKQHAESNGANTSEKDYKELLENRAATKTRRVLAEWDPILFNSKRIQCASRREPLILRKEYRRKFQNINGTLGVLSFTSNIEDGVKLLRHFDQDERETDGAVHCDTTRPKLLRGFWENGDWRV